MNIVKRLLFFGILFSAIPPKVLSISTGFFQLSIFRATTIIAFLILLLVGILKDKQIKIYGVENKYSVVFLLIWLIYAFFSVIWAKDFALWLRGTYFISLGILCVFLFQSVFRDKKDIIFSFFLLSIMSIFHNFIGWYEVFTSNYHFSGETYADRYARAQLPVSMFGNVNDFSLYMLFSIFILYVCYKNSNLLLLKSVYLISVVSTVCLILVVSSRGVLIGLIMAFAWFIFIIYKDNRIRLLATSSIILLGSLFVFSADFRTAIFSIFGINDQEIVLSEETGRINLLKNGLYFLYKTFGFGTGAGNIEHWMQYESIYYTGPLLNIHNWWAEILVGYGIIIFVMYLVFYTNLFKSFYKSYILNDNIVDKSLSIMFMCTIIGFIVASISSSSVLDTEWLWVYWALGVVYQGMLKIEKPPSNEGINDRSSLL